MVEQDPGQVVQVGDRRLVLRNLDKVLYPATGTTKGEVLVYYTQVAEVMLRHLADRPLTRKRWPHGVAAQSFFEKNLPNGTPDWVRRVRLPVPGSTKDRQTIVYPLAEELADLIWLAGLAALELHVPQWIVAADVAPGTFRGTALPPNRLVIDLDPGPGAGLDECAEVALAVRDRLALDDVVCLPVTSGGKGMQLYAPIRGDQPGEVIVAYVKSVAEELERALPALVVSRMTKALRPGKVLIDWSQNTPAKTTISPYSLRGRQRPCAAAPRSWWEVETGALAQLDLNEVPQRLAQDGDLLAVLADSAGTELVPRVPQ